MDNKEVVKNLKESVEKITSNITILVECRDSIPTTTADLRQQRNRLTSLIAKLIAEQNSLESIINEREASLVSFTPLDQASSAAFINLIHELDKVIQADQEFNKIVAMANGIKAAADEIEKITG